tara:strand:- start:162 stop:443 length:282 start_codon:yes stop_codon:yes gene_type:complete
MKVKQIMERAGLTETGRGIAYIKDGLDEINMYTEIHTKTQRIDINKDQRFYKTPDDMVKTLDIRMKNHLNSKDEYRSIPRLLYKPTIKDSDNI